MSDDMSTFLYVPREGNFTAAELEEYPEQVDCKGYLTKVIAVDCGKGGKSQNPHTPFCSQMAGWSTSR
eukprot:1318705-Prymnesium_polylepis.1